MARYIDADKAHEEIDTFQTSLESNDDKVWRKNKPYYKGLAIARGIINEIPTADVVEVKRGKWEICCDGYYPYCSVCKAEPRSGVMSNYCPECGADMRPLDKTLDKD